VDALAESPGGYRTLDLGGALAIAGATGSSTRNGYFPCANTIDGRLSTAWAPAWTDGTPGATFDLGGLSGLTTLGIKLSLGRYSSPTNHRVAVDVLVSTDGETFVPLASGLAPAETSLTTFNLPACEAAQVRLAFRTASDVPIQQLLVCEVRFSGAPGAGPTDAPQGPEATPPVVLPTFAPTLPPPPTFPPTLPPPPTFPPTLPPIILPTYAPTPPVVVPSPPVATPTPKDHPDHPDHPDPQPSVHPTPPNPPRGH
jgi:hypothetical protein